MEVQKQPLPSDCVIPRELSRRGFDCNETMGDAAANVLGRLGLEITVERFLAALKRNAVVFLMQRLKTKRRRHSTPNNSRWRSIAFLRAGLGFGG